MGRGEEGREVKEEWVAPRSWGLWIWQWRRRGKEEGQGGELGLRRPGTSFSTLSTAPAVPSFAAFIYLRSGEYDRFAEVLQHERQCGRCVSHCVSAVQYDKAIILRVVLLYNVTISTA